MNWNVLRSIFKRDFVSYFSSPTGYVFICVFVVLSALATFWPPEFFSSNLANLDQLSRWLPFIMLVFIPAITMSIWAEERQQGTDELLLTIPATDLDVVLGKYLAGVAIFTVSLMFSAFSIFLVFKWGLGDPDAGLFASTYIGYWFIGAAMIAIGMVASFLTDNLTVGFILGMLFNLPLAMAGVADWFIKDPAVAQVVRKWGALEQFRDFERGVVSLGGATYFVMISIVMLYISMVLIGRRHWQARDNGGALLGHYTVRAIALLCLAVGVTQFVQSHNLLRADISSEQLSSLSADTRKLLQDLRNDPEVKTIKIDAYVSPQVPAEYVSTKLDFLTTLAELQALSGKKVQVTKHEIENHGPEAVLAESTYGITPREVMIVKGQERSQEEFFLAAAVTAGLKKVVIPFIDKGIPVEYELVRSITTVSKNKTYKIGIIDTGLPFMNPSSDRSREWPLITELRKQYDIDDRPVDPSQPIKDSYDVLIAVQPSMLGPQELDHLVDAIRSGIPTAILEDPHPHFYPASIASTAEPRQPPGGMMGMFNRSGPIPKGDISQLWRTLGVNFNPMEVVWQVYDPEQSIRVATDDQWIFVDEGNGAHDPLSSDSPITSGLNQLLLIYPGAISKAEDSKLDFEQLVVTGSDNSGTIATPGMRRGGANMRAFDNRTSSSFILAAYIHGTLPDDDMLLTGDALENEAEETDESKDADAEEAASPEQDEPAGQEINAVVVADIDWIIPDFFMIRQSGGGEVLPATQNVTFILNIIDTLAGDDRFIEIRKRTRKHRTLAKIDEATKAYRDTRIDQENEFVQEFKTELEEVQKRFEEQVAAVDKIEGLSRTAREQRKEAVQLREQAKLEAAMKSIDSKRKRKLKQIQYQMEQEVRGVQDRYKLYAIMIPPIPPLLLALYVFFQRRKSEREGIAKTRLR
ncbi:MAG: ABC transporter permease subunit [Planctomycetes bacterium]|nr:ABC transporter permease subunit [Planctomycetota bacterium]